MAVKLATILAALVLFTGACEALDCISCFYEEVNGIATNGSMADCKYFATNTNTIMCEENEKCSVQNTMIDENNYSWIRGCEPSCGVSSTQSRNGSYSWQRCCNNNSSCNDYATYWQRPGGIEPEMFMCYRCSFTRDSNGNDTGTPSCETDVRNDDDVTKVACFNKCFTSKMTMGNMTTWMRGCQSSCTNVGEMTDDEYKMCCEENNCNGGGSEETGGAINIRAHNFLSAMFVVVAMVIGTADCVF